MSRRTAQQPDLFESSTGMPKAPYCSDAYSAADIARERDALHCQLERLRQAETTPWPDPTRCLSAEIAFHNGAQNWFPPEEAHALRRAFVAEMLRLELRSWPLYVTEIAPDLYRQARREMGLPEDDTEA